MSFLLTSTRYSRRVYAASGPVVTLQLVPLPSRVPFSPPCVTAESEEDERACRHPICPPRLVRPPFAVLSLAHAMINITPQSYGIQTNLETDFFFPLKASLSGAVVQLPSRNFSNTRNRKPEREIKSREERRPSGSRRGVPLRSFPCPRPSRPAGRGRNGVDNSPGNCVARLNCHTKSSRLISWTRQVPRSDPIGVLPITSTRALPSLRICFCT